MKNVDQTGLLRAVPVLGSRWLRKIKILVTTPGSDKKS